MQIKQKKERFFYFKHSSTISDDKLLPIIEKEAYATKREWGSFMELFFLALGSGLGLAGVVFFFAFNWAGISTLTKFALIGALLCISVFLSVYPAIKRLYRQIALLSSSILVGVLYAVFGQEYQTGANAYDFFLAWLLSISVWTIISRFTFQWLLFALLANTTLVLYCNQILILSESIFLFTLMILLNSVLLGGIIGRNKLYSTLVTKDWYLKILLVAILTLTTLTLLQFVFIDTYSFENHVVGYLFSLILSILCLSILCFHSVRKKVFFEFCLFFLCVFCLGLGLLIRLLEDSTIGFLIYSGYLIGGSFVLINYMVKTLKRWSNEDKQ